MHVFVITCSKPAILVFIVLFRAFGFEHISFIKFAFYLAISEEHSEPCQMSELKISFTNEFIFDIWLSSELSPLSLLKVNNTVIVLFLFYSFLILLSLRKMRPLDSVLLLITIVTHWTIYLFWLSFMFVKNLFQDLKCIHLSLLINCWNLQYYLIKYHNWKTKFS